MLGAMFGYAHLLQQDTLDNPMAQESVAEILKAATRAKELVQQILTFSRRRETNRQVVRLDATLREAAKFLRASLPAQITIQTQFAADAPAVLADPSQIYQVTMNLATNALHAMEGRPGQLTLALASFQPGEAFLRTHPRFSPIQYARLTVADTGQGMDALTLDRIFEPFFTTKPVGKGTGLGLSVVHGIMEAHHGIIIVESHPGLGTKFSLYFPAEATAATATAASVAVPVATPLGSGQHILVLDDEAALTAMIQKYMRRLDYQVTTSNHPAEAIRWFRENPAQFQLVITDLTMPEMNGLEVARQIHALRPELPVILVSGIGVTVDVEQLRAAGICERLDKPVALVALAELVERVLTRQGLRPARPSGD
jgi:CheY-like chemotaxis protein